MQGRRAAGGGRSATVQPCEVEGGQSIAIHRPESRVTTLQQTVVQGGQVTEDFEEHSSPIAKKRQDPGGFQHPEEINKIKS